MEHWNIKKQEVKETANVPSSEGLISTLDVSLIYSYPKENVAEIRKTIGRTPEKIVIQPYMREVIRSVASGYSVKSLYSEAGRAEISSKMFDRLKNWLDPKGIRVEDVLLRDVQLPGTFKASIEAKLMSEQQALQKEFELQKARKDAEIEVARAKGVAESNNIIAGSITENYLKYLFIQQLQDSETDIIYIPTEAGLPILEAARKGD